MVQTRNNFVNTNHITITLTYRYRQERFLLQKALEENFPNLKNKFLDQNEYSFFSDNVTFNVSITPETGNEIREIKINSSILNIYYTLKYDFLEYLIQGILENSISLFEDDNSLEPNLTTLSKTEYSKKVKIYKSPDSHIYCNLSLDNIRKGVLVGEIKKCGHKFKNIELKKYLTKFCIRPTCPTCRAEI